MLEILQEIQKSVLANQDLEEQVTQRIIQQLSADIKVNNFC